MNTTESKPTCKRLAIYAHYDGHGEVKRYVLHLLRCLQGVCDSIDFVSTADLSAPEQAKLNPLCRRVLLKDNKGFDFGMWQNALQNVDLDAWDEIVLLNSSMFGPVFPLQEMFRQMQSRPVDFWGVTENHEMSWHLQSYFLVFRKRLLQSSAFTSFWQSVLPYSDKSQVIRSYEVGMSGFFRQEGFTGEAYVPIQSLIPPAPFHLTFSHPRSSPTAYHPKKLLDHGMPFVKAETLRDNPGRVDLKALRRAMIKSGYDLSLVEFDRRSTQKDWQEKLKMMVSEPPWRALLSNELR